MRVRLSKQKSNDRDVHPDIIRRKVRPKNSEKPAIRLKDPINEEDSIKTQSLQPNKAKDGQLNEKEAVQAKGKGEVDNLAENDHRYEMNKIKAESKVNVRGESPGTKIVEKSGKIIVDIQDGSNQVFVIDKKYGKSVLKDLENNFGNNFLILNSTENKKIGLKYGETLKQYSSLNSNLYPKDEQIYFDLGYDYQYKNNNPPMENEPWEIRILYLDTDFSNYALIFNSARLIAKKDISKGYMNRVNPELKRDIPTLKVTDTNNNIRIYINGQESTLTELYKFNR